jgi:Protein kinase domain
LDIGTKNLMNFIVQIVMLRSLDLDFNYVEQVSCFVVGERDSYHSGGHQQYCIAVEQPSLTLDRVVAGMLKNDACRDNSDLRHKYVIKMLSVLRIVAKALQRLHSVGVIHGNLTPEACGKFGDQWKLLRVFGFQKVGQVLDTKRCVESVPPEVLEPHNNTIAVRQVALRNNLSVDPSIDIWGFGKLAYEALVGEPLVEGDLSKELQNDQPCLLKILHWSTLDLVEVRHRLRKVEVPDAAAYLITKCLSQDPSNRPSMNEILRSDLWENIHRRAQAVDTSSLHEC